MSEENGYAQPGDVFKSCNVKRFADVEVQGLLFCFTSWTSRELERYNTANRKKENRLIANERLIAGVCVDHDSHELIFTGENIDQLRDLDAGFVVELAGACMKHLGLEIEEDEPEKN